MTYYERQMNRSHTKAISIVIGLLVMVSVVGFLAMPLGKSIPEADGTQIDPMNAVQTTYSLKNMNCAFTQMSCNLGP